MFAILSQQYFGIITLDVINAFNSTNWEQLITTKIYECAEPVLVRKCYCMIQTNGRMKYKITASIP